MTAPSAAMRRFYKMSGSGNDFVVFDARRTPPGRLAEPATIQELCIRRTGVGSDGVVFILPPTGPDADFRMAYFNRDGSRGEMCGNASLCVTQLASTLGAASPAGMRFETDSGMVSARMADGLPEVDLAPVSDVQPEIDIALEPGELRIGFARVGNPHIVVLREELESLDVIRRGRALRLHRAVQPRGANANFVAPDGHGGFRIRTYERGVEDETLACGTGSIASMLLLAIWQQSGRQASLTTRSGLTIHGTLREEGGTWYPTIRGQGRLVFTGELTAD